MGGVLVFGVGRAGQRLGLPGADGADAEIGRERAGLQLGGEVLGLVAGLAGDLGHPAGDRARVSGAAMTLPSTVIATSSRVRSSGLPAWAPAA